MSGHRLRYQKLSAQNVRSEKWQDSPDKQSTDGGTKESSIKDSQSQVCLFWHNVLCRFLA